MNRTLTLRINPYTLKKLDIYLGYVKASYSTRSSFISEAIEEHLIYLEGRLLKELKNDKRDLFKEDLKHLRKANYLEAIEARKKEIKASLNKYFSRNKIQKFIDNEKPEIGKWLYEEYGDHCEEFYVPLKEPYNPKFDI